MPFEKKILYMLFRSLDKLQSIMKKFFMLFKTLSLLNFATVAKSLSENNTLCRLSNFADFLERFYAKSFTKYRMKVYLTWLTWSLTILSGQESISISLLSFVLKFFASSIWTIIVPPFLRCNILTITVIKIFFNKVFT